MSSKLHPPRPPVLLTIFLFALLVTPALRAQTVTSLPAAPNTLEEAAAQRAQADQLRKTAEETQVLESAACNKKILVNDCLIDVKKRYTQSIIEARELEKPARDFEREAHRVEVEDKAAQRAIDNAQRKTDQQAQAEAYRAEEATKAAEREKRLAEHAQKVEAGNAKAAAEDARRQAKQAEREKKLAERAARQRKQSAGQN